MSCLKLSKFLLVFHHLGSKVEQFRRMTPRQQLLTASNRPRKQLARCEIPEMEAAAFLSLCPTTGRYCRGRQLLSDVHPETGRFAATMKHRNSDQGRCCELTRLSLSAIFSLTSAAQTPGS